MELSTYHVTCVMHGSRTSLRMLANKIKNNIPEYLYPNEEEKLIEIICNHIIKYQLNIYSFNICADHIHFIINCETSKLEYFVGRLKSITSRDFNIWRGITIPKSEQFLQNNDINNFLLTGDHASFHIKNRGETQNSLWAQKFNRVKIDSIDQLRSTIHYIENNRQKHRLPLLSNISLKKIASVISTNYTNI